MTMAFAPMDWIKVVLPSETTGPRSRVTFSDAYFSMMSAIAFLRVFYDAENVNGESRFRQ